MPALLTTTTMRPKASDRLLPGGEGDAKSQSGGRGFEETQHICTPSETKDPRPAVTGRTCSPSRVNASRAQAQRDRSEHLGIRVATHSKMGKGDSSPELWWINEERAVSIRPLDGTGWMIVDGLDSRQYYT